MNALPTRDFSIHVSPFPTSRALALEAAPYRHLLETFLDGTTPDVDALVGWEFRGINHPNWAQVGQSGGLNFTPNAGTFGQVTQKSTTNPRNLQVGLKFLF